jgi:2'-5' RNA ligase
VDLTYSIWLEFDDTSNSALQDEVMAISNEFGGPRFAPHLTMIGDLDLPVKAVEMMAEQIARSWHPEKLLVEDVGASTKYFMALYLEIRIPDSMVTLRNSLFLAADATKVSQDEPHVSLAYGDYPYGALSQVRSRLKQKFVGTSLGVRYINVVRSSKCIPIADWKTVSRVGVN